MKKSFIGIAAVLASCLLVSPAFVSCADDNGGDNQGNTQEIPVDDPVIAAAIEKITIPETVEKSCTLVLPSSVAVEEQNVTVAWSSSDTSVINTAGTVTPKAGGEEDKVTLTAVFIHDGKTYKKAYSVAVWQEGKFVVNSALNQVSFDYTPASYAYQTVTVPSSVTIAGQNVSVAYTSSDESAVNTDSASFGRMYVTKDLTEKTVTLTATVSYNGASASKEFPLTVPACTEFEEDYYNDDTMTGYSKISFDMENKTVISEHKYSNSDLTSKKYSFEFGEEPGQLVLTFVAVKGEPYCADKDKWYTEDDLYELCDGLTAQLKALSENPPETYEALGEAFELLGMDEEDFWDTLDEMGASKNDSEEQQKTVCAQFVEAIVQMSLEQAGVDTLDEYTSVAVKQMLGAEADGDIFKYSITKTDYSTDNCKKIYPNGADIRAEAVYDSTRSWFDQYGSYRISTDNNEYFCIYCNNGRELCWENKYIEGSYNEDHTEFTSSVGTFTLVDTKDGVVAVSDGSRTCYLNFEGKNL